MIKSFFSTKRTGGGPKVNYQAFLETLSIMNQGSPKPVEKNIEGYIQQIKKDVKKKAALKQLLGLEDECLPESNERIMDLINNYCIKMGMLDYGDNYLY